MLRTAHIIGISLFLLSHAMLFFSRQHDPINASVMMLASILMAVGMLRFLSAPHAPISNRLGTLFWVIGFFLMAFMHFDIMALGITPAYMHQGKLLWNLSHITLALAAVCFAIWIYAEDRSQLRFAVGALAGVIIFGLMMQFSFNAVLNATSALIFAAACTWLAIYKIVKY